LVTHCDYLYLQAVALIDYQPGSEARLSALLKTRLVRLSHWFPSCKGKPARFCGALIGASGAELDFRKPYPG
jgi:hypothetical protein